LIPASVDAEAKYAIWARDVRVGEGQFCAEKHDRAE
jgi:hypothetical protein